MKNTMLASVIAIAFAAPALAADQAAMVVPEKLKEVDAVTIQEASEDIDYTAKESLGKDVHNEDGMKIATIENMGISDDGEVEYVMIKLSADMSAGQEMVAVPHDEFEWDEEKKMLMLDIE